MTDMFINEKSNGLDAQLSFEDSNFQELATDSPPAYSLDRHRSSVKQQTRSNNNKSSTTHQTISYVLPGSDMSANKETCTLTLSRQSYIDAGYLASVLNDHAKCPPRCAVRVRGFHKDCNNSWGNIIDDFDLWLDVTSLLEQAPAQAAFLRGNNGNSSTGELQPSDGIDNTLSSVIQHFQGDVSDRKRYIMSADAFILETDDHLL